MARATGRGDAWPRVLAAISVAGWAVIMLDGSGAPTGAWCSVDAPWTAPPTISFDLTLGVGAWAARAVGWLLMLLAMMAPLVIEPLRHVRARSFARRRARATSLFLIGYLAVWMVAGLGLQAVAIALSAALPPAIGSGVIVMVAVLWQCSPTKQGCLNRCHRRPALAAFGLAADRDALAFGAGNGASCVGTCWALMLLAIAPGLGQVWAMMAVSLFLAAERLERAAPRAWRWRVPAKAIRILIAQARLRLVPRRDAPTSR